MNQGTGAPPAHRPIRKMLVANRGEIAVRAFRAAAEMGIGTVAVYPWEDRNAVHRAKADESHQIGEEGHAVRAYLDVGAIVEAARGAGADAVYPGYGFLSENADFARACAGAGLTFIGPDPEVLDLTGDKAAAVAAAGAAGLPTLASSEPTDDLDALADAARGMTFPLFVKAVAGGGGRGMRFVGGPDELASAAAAASREALAAFGDGTVYLEEAVIEPRHIEVQILGDATGEVIHLYERDCSVQRRHQKVVEIAPAPDLDPDLRDRICADAVAFARDIGYRGAGTVEFLVDASGRHVFIEMNPRIQVEHTVTEEITDVDLVAAQLRIAAGETLADLGLAQDGIRIRGAALQCRITTEDPANDFRPDTGRITVYRSPGGAGVRLDSAAQLGGEVSPHFDSMLVKLTCRGKDLPAAVARARRALAEFRIRGVATNLGFLRALLEEPDFLSGRVSTSFIADHPALLAGRPSADRASKLLNYLVDVTVNQPNGPRPDAVRPSTKLPAVDLSQPPPPGSRRLLRELGPEGFARRLRRSDAVAVTDTTYRDAHQSLLATRLRTSGLERAAAHSARLLPGIWSAEVWGGATYDVALRFLHEDPWERLDRIRAAMPDTCLQMLIRGRNTVGYAPYPAPVVDAFVAEAAESGIDVFRVFDALNDVERMRPAIDAVRATGTSVAEVALAYTGDLSDPAEDLYTLDYYLRLAEKAVDAGAHVLAIKDMAGLLRPSAAVTLVRSLRSEFDLPVHVHTHDTAGGQLATYLAAIEAGADAVDVAASPLAGTTSQPSMAALVAALAHTGRDTGIDLAAVQSMEPYWEAVRAIYAPFESGIPGPTGRVYDHEIPGGQLSNLRTQSGALGLADRFEQVEDAYAGVNRILGRPPKVTPSSKVVGDLALQLVAAGVGAEEFADDPGIIDLPDSVLGFLRGDLGVPPGGWPEPLRGRILDGRTVPPEPAIDVDPGDERILAAGAGAGGEGRAELRGTLDRILFPGPAKEFREHRDAYGDVSVLTATQFFYGLREGEETVVHLDGGVDLIVRLESLSGPDGKGLRTAMCTVNGQLRPVTVRDRSVETATPQRERADESNPGHVAAPFAGVVTVTAEPGTRVSKGDQVGGIEAMKMEGAISAPCDGVVERVALTGPTRVEGGDLLLVVAPAE
ncbi:Biotin carboxylase [Corynebacterium hansenii]|nr:pyruvate carboxylase [Corynebacterium hansenii]WJZ00849.1 Biotin carboxylase [Corynebacterium hansenii]